MDERCQVLFSTDSSSLSPSNARFHFRKQGLKGWAQKSTTRSWQENSGDRRNWINPVLPNRTIWYLKSQLFQFLQKSEHGFPAYNWRHKHFSFNEPIIWRQRKRWAGFTSLGAAITNHPSNESEWTKTKTMLIIHGSISRNIFSPENDFWVKKYLAYNAYKKGK